MFLLHLLFHHAQWIVSAQSLLGFSLFENVVLPHPVGLLPIKKEQHKSGTCENHVLDYEMVNMCGVQLLLL